eukprot:scaffold3258_cov15-Tisochrysis_lutea.AAC.1
MLLGCILKCPQFMLNLQKQSAVVRAREGKECLLGCDKQAHRLIVFKTSALWLKSMQLDAKFKVRCFCG